MKSLLSLFIFSTFLSLSALAQEDAEGCKDHPMFTRMPNYYLYECSKNFASLDVMYAANKTQAHEGTRTKIDYRFNVEGAGKQGSWLQIIKNYENAVTRLGGKKLFSNNEYASYQVKKDGRDIIVQISFITGDELQVEQFSLDVLEKEPMKQDVSANDIYSALTTSGSIALNIHFETGKTDIKHESMKIVDQLAQTLRSNPSLKISIEGHTDNVGDASSNKSLSANRAHAVLVALTEKGIDRGRMAARGWGQEKPVADNSTEEGRARNRRVEIVNFEKLSN